MTQLRSAPILLICLLQALIFVCYVRAYSVDIPPGEKLCFIVPATAGATCSGSYEVISEFEPDMIKVAVVGPSPKNFLHFSSEKPIKAEGREHIQDDPGFTLGEGSFSFDAPTDGDYTMCLANGEPDDNDGEPRTVAFNLRALAYGQEDGYEYVGLQSELLALQQGLDFLKDHQAYMNQREDVHKLALESINIKLTCWTILESLILVGMAFWQISYIRSFFEIKRRL